MSLKTTINDFNRVAANIELVQLLTNEPMNTLSFISTTEDIVLTTFAGSVTKSELESTLGAGDLVEKIWISLTQSTAGGTLIKPTELYVAGKVLADTPGTPTEQEKTDFENFLQGILFDVTVTNSRQFTGVIFSDVSDIVSDEDFVSALDIQLQNWYCVGFLPVDDPAVMTTKIKDEVKNFFFVQTYENPATTYEPYIEAAFAGRVVYQGVGNSQGVARELTGITAYLPSFIGGEDGKLTTSEAAALRAEGLNIYTRYVNNKNETSGLKNPSGTDFTHTWALYKVTADLSQDLHQLRHNTEVLTTSPQDEGTVRGVIVDRMARLKRPKNEGGQEVIFDYRVTAVPLDYTLEPNKGRFEYNIEVSLFNEAVSFTLNVTGYQDGREFNIEEA